MDVPRKRLLQLTLAGCFIVLAGGAWWLHARVEANEAVVALIPQAAGPMRWESEHVGAAIAADERKLRLYWNGPTSEADFSGQVSLIEKVRRNRSRGIVVAPTNPYILLSPLRRAMDEGIAVVVVSSMLPLPAGRLLTYVVNDDEQMGELAGREMVSLLGGKGAIGVVGLGRAAPNIQVRARAAEQFFVRNAPGIRIVARLGSAYNTGRTDELTSEMLETHPEIRGVLSLASPATLGAHAALKRKSLHRSISLVGCEQDTEIVSCLRNGEISAIAAENTYAMGHRAVAIIADFLQGKPLPPPTSIPPILLTRANLDSPDAEPYLKVSR